MSTHRPAREPAAHELEAVSEAWRDGWRIAPERSARAAPLDVLDYEAAVDALKRLLADSRVAIALLTEGTDR